MKPKSLYLDSARPSPLPILGPRVAHSLLDVVVEYATKLPATRRHLAALGPRRDDNIRLVALLCIQ